MMPVRIQRKRTAGWRTPEAAIYVGRPTIWGNPFGWLEARDEYGISDEEARSTVAGIYRDWLTMTEPERFSEHLRTARVAILSSLAELRGRDLCCWCPLPAPGEPDHCHAAVLLELANAPKCP
jgi:Domain of unknown function (DUF4326)